MKQLLLFGGAAESHALLAELAGRAVTVSLSVATDYGRDMLAGADLRDVELLTGRMDCDAIAALLQSRGYGCVVDATHPYAVEATANIRAAAHRAGVPCLRLLRDDSVLDRCTVVDSADEAAGLLAKTDDNVLLTTGSKDLPAFAAIPDAARRLYVRVLPSSASIAACLDQGIARSHILAMQGPFSTALNTALMREWDIGTVVSKDGGPAGGFAEKEEAAQALGARMIVIRRPEEAGLPLQALLENIDKWLEEMDGCE